jgi:ABC-type multidrug transport system fused ATPase/permease subunit
VKEVGMRRIMQYYSPKWMAVVAFLTSLINAFAFPIYGFIFAKLLFIMMAFKDPRIDYYYERNFWCGMFLLEVALVGIFSFLQQYLFLYVGENLTFDVRNELFRQIIYKHISWFDNKERAPGILSNILSEDIGVLNGMTTENIAILLEAFLALVIGVVIAMFYTWRMGLITLAMVPLVILGGLMSARLQFKGRPSQTAANNNNGQPDPYQQSNALLSDILLNYRTVVGFGEKNVKFLLQKFDELLYEPNMVGIRTGHLDGFWFGYSQCIRFVFIGVVFYICSILINKHVENPQDTYIGVYVLFVAALGTGNALSKASSIAKSKEAAVKVFGIIDEPSQIDTRT